MKISILKTVLLLGTTVAFLSFDTPTGWITGGNKVQAYEMGIDKGAGQNGGNAGTIKSIDKRIDGFGTLMQQCKPGKYLGRRVRMSGYVRTEHVASSAGLWFRVDKAGSERAVSFDNMYDRPIKGTSSWKKYEIVLDVPADASMLAYGALLDGTGQVWFDNITFEIVDDVVPTTGSTNARKNMIQDEPNNLNFEK